MSIWVPDVSEFQSVDWDVFSGPIIVRTHNSARPDRKWAQHAAGAAAQPWWGAYQYLTRNADPAAAARNFLATLGDYRPNVTIIDIEEGDGDQSARQHAWLEVMADDPARDWTYSGDYFARVHGLTVEWRAAYQKRAPTTAHLLWQAADNHSFPGIGICDGSLFDGTVADLITLTGGTAPSADPPPFEEDDVKLMRFLDAPDKWWAVKQDPSVPKAPNGTERWGYKRHIPDPEILRVLKAHGWEVVEGLQEAMAFYTEI